VDHFAAAFTAAAAPNYLGSPAVVAEILGSVLLVAIAYAKGEESFNGAWNVMFELATQIAESDNYVRMPSWHTPAALGKHLVAVLGVRDEEHFADDLSYFVSEAFMLLFLKTLELIRDNPSEAGQEIHFMASPWIEEIHEWAATVFLGTNGVVAPGRTLSDFR
jgi:hypothetical protein